MLLDAPGQRERLVNKMSNLRQDRVPGPTLAPTSPPSSDSAAINGRASAPRDIVLSLRLRIPDSSGSAASVSWSADGPATAMAIDIMSASGGALDPPQGTVAQFRFFNLQSAVLGARRLQWALEGLADTAQAASAAMAIHSVEEMASVEGTAEGSAAQMLESLGPGLVLLSAAIAEPVQQLPGAVLRDASHRSWRELQWRSEGPKNIDADQQSVLGLIRGLGRQDPCAPQQEPAPSKEPASTPAAAAYQPQPTLGRSVDEPDAATTPFWKKPWVLVSAGAVVLVLLATVIIPMMVSGGHPKAPVKDGTTISAPSPSSSSTPTGVAPSSAAAPSLPGRTRDQKPGGKPARQPRAPGNAGTGAEPTSPRPAASCDLTEGEIPPSLQRAERLMFAGKLADAQDAYQRLAGCPTAREKALEGLRIVKQRMATQGP